MPTELTTPPGRVVWGHPTKSRVKTDQKKQPVLKDGQPVQQWSFGVAYDKATFQQHVWPALAAEAATAYPQGVPPSFSWKYVDGDGVDREGKPYNTREGYAGCFVLAISTETFAPPVFKLVNGAYQQLPAEAIKTGDYVAVGLNLKVNVPQDRTHTPGVYVNPVAIEFVGYGTEIVSQATADPNAIFKGAQYQLPPGASATPVAAPGAPGMPGMGMPPAAGAPMAPPAPGMAAPPMQQPAPPPMAPPAAPALARPTDPTHIAPNPAGGGEMWWINGAWTPAPVLPPPAPDFIANAGMPMAPPAMTPPPPPAAPTMIRPTDPTHIAANPAGGELWWINGAWTPGAQPGMLPPR